MLADISKFESFISNSTVPPSPPKHLRQKPFDTIMQEQINLKDHRSVFGLTYKDYENAVDMYEIAAKQFKHMYANQDRPSSYLTAMRQQMIDFESALYHFKNILDHNPEIKKVL